MRRLDREMSGSSPLARGRLAALLATAAALATMTQALAGSSFPCAYYFQAGDEWALNGGSSPSLPPAAAQIHAPAAWCVSTGAGITIADVDTGADFSHPDLAGKLIPGARFTSGGGSSSSPDGTGQSQVQDDAYPVGGHGTMTTGIMVADTYTNAGGIASVAPDARALIVKVLQPTTVNGQTQEAANDQDVAAGIEWAADHGAKVINVSLGIDSNQPAVLLANGALSNIPAAIQHAYNAGAAVALAAGNSSSSFTEFQVQQVDSQALVVGAVNRDGALASYSNSGSGVNIYAPGGDKPEDRVNSIISTFPVTHQNGQTFEYAYDYGTSFAAPMIAGTLALLMAQGLTNSAAMSRIKSSAVMRNGLPELDAAAALHSPGTCGSPCATPASGGGGGGGVIAAGGGGAHQTSAPPRPQSPRPAAHPTPSPSLHAATPSPSPSADVALDPSPPPANADVPRVPIPPSPAPSPWVAVAIVATLLAAGGAALYLRFRPR
jgi:serine protease